MPLADLSIDDAIALACREVPECCHAPEWHWEDGDSFQTARWVHTEGGPLVDGPMLRAIWFATAWEWLERLETGYRVSCDSDGAWGVYDHHKGDWHIADVPPTKYHALAAAVLLAAGKEIP